MSYCRSGPNSNVYCYLDVGGFWWVSTDAAKRRKGVRFPKDILTCWENWDQYYETRTEVWAGKKWQYKTALGVLRRLTWLREKGALVPEYALKRLREEMKQGNHVSSHLSSSV